MLSQEIKSYLPKIKEYFSRQPINRAWLFGSCSRGEETPESNVDILVDYDHDNNVISLFTIIKIALGLEDIIGRKVDLVENGCLKEFAVESVDHDKILVYEK